MISLPQTHAGSEPNHGDELVQSLSWRSPAGGAGHDKGRRNCMQYSNCPPVVCERDAVQSRSWRPGRIDDVHEGRPHRRSSVSLLLSRTFACYVYSHLTCRLWQNVVSDARNWDGERNLNRFISGMMWRSSKVDVANQLKYVPFRNKYMSFCSSNSSTSQSTHAAHPGP